MQAIILAAGMGSRLGRYTTNNTKCMVEVAGRKLIDRTLESIQHAGIDHVVIVEGYKGRELVSYIKKTYAFSKIKFDFIKNEKYATTNNIYSLYLAKDFLISDDSILIESDIIFENGLIGAVSEMPYTDVAVVAKYMNWMSGTVVTCKGGVVAEFVDRKNIDYDDLDKYYKTVNIYKFSKEFCSKAYVPQLEKTIDDGQIGCYYEDVLRNIIRISDAILYEYEIGDMKWYEIDDLQDLDIATTIFSEDEEKYERLTSTFGGYWRYPDIDDFCFLVNPYYPSQIMIDKMKSEYESLLGNYPSSLKIQDLNAERIFNVSKDKIIVGNGASELINILGIVTGGKIAIPVPTFNEYIRCFRNSEKRMIRNKENDFIPSKKDYCSAAKDSDMICIVNPDNPSGFMFSKKDVLDIISFCKENGTKIVVDESFVDFASSKERFTLLDEKLLNEYPNLIVIRSIGKTYGVAGLRLGVLASSDGELIAKMKEYMPIWNINSFAEYYLQIYNDFSSDYIRSCDLIADERSCLVKKLGSVNGIKVYPSHANYVMIGTGDMDSREICIKMMSEGFLLKDLSGKDHFDGDNYIRIAVKSKAENEKLIVAFKKVIKEMQ